MMINRHNYEEFFLLYADDELNSQQRAAVELFVQQNPDMAVELETLQQMKLQPEEHIVFPDKSSLFKTTDVEININNYEEFFFLYIDRELDETAREKVEKFVLQHPQVQDEFTLLKQTVLQPEAIVFTDKSSLYRKEERKVAYIGFVRMAVAAAVIGIAVLGWWLYPTGKVTPDSNQVVVNPPAVKQVTPPKTIDTTVIPAPQNAQQNVAAADDKKAQDKTKQQPTVVPVTQNSPANTAVINTKKLQDKTIQPLQKVNNQVQQAPVVQPGNDNIAYNPAPKVIDTTVSINQLPVAVANTNPALVANVEDNPKAADITPVIITSDQLKQNPDHREDVVAVNVPYKVIDTDDEDRSMYIGSLELNKDKVKGFLKRAGRLFGGGKGKKELN
jgi:hypothetical protein